MRIPRFYLPQALQCDTGLELPPELFRHAIQVLRMKKGEALIVFNGEGGEYHAELTDVTRRQAMMRIGKFDPVDRESPLALTLVQSIIKPDKMDFAIQKSVELGVHTIQPLISQRSVVRPGRDKLDKKQCHWQAVAISACEQSGRTCVPDILPTLTLEAWLKNTADDVPTRLLLMPGDHPPLNALGESIPCNTAAFSVLIGPEGGFSQEEARQCIDNGVQAISLGPRILRAETASTAIITLLQQQHGDLHCVSSRSDLHSKP